MIENNKQPIFIFEGPDNSGKDTLIGMLKEYIWNFCKETTLEIHPKFEKNINNEYKYYFQKECEETISMLKNINRIIIFNRFVHSEYIYGQKYRNYNIDYISKIEEKLLNLNRPVFLIYTYAKPEILRTREDGLSFSEGELNNIKQELKLYNEIILDKSILNIIKIDTSSCNPNNDFKKIIKEINISNICKVIK